MAGQDPSAAKRDEAAAALLAVLESAFPGDQALAQAVRTWVAFENTDEPGCALCTRPLRELAVQAGASRPQLVRGTYATVDAVCGACVAAARETFAVAPIEGPSWDMLLAQLERALALLPEEQAAITRACLAKRPHGSAEGTCVLCSKILQTARSRVGGVCDRCSREARDLFQDLAARDEVVGGNTRCPKCGSDRISAGAVHIEFTELTCLACGHSEICDVWQLDDWRS